MSLTDEAQTTHLQRIRQALAIETHQLTPCEMDDAITESEQFTRWLKAQKWGLKMGWDIPARNTIAAVVLLSTWSESEERRDR